MRLGLEPVHPSQHDSVSFVNSIADAVALLDEAGLDDVGIMADTYNLWEEAPRGARSDAPRVTGLHVADVAVRARTHRSRAPRRRRSCAPPSSSHALVDAGWDGFLDVEIFSTP